MKKPIRILLADDHPPLRAGLAAILNGQSDFKVVAEAGSGAEVMRSAEVADVYILDLRMPDGDGIQTIRDLIARDSATHVMVLTTYDNEEDIFRALEAGARGYLLKDTTSEELVAAVRQIHAGERYLPQAVAARLADRLIRPNLTPRELDVLRLVSRGRTNKEMASAMFISEETVKTHMKSLFQKLGVHDRAEAVSVSLQRGLIRL
ncbi:response regulator transcription factor [Luteolibacter sp. GHJ8]|uniref:Response regulator transcription factor n=1 Tax=Luteolibacter rhizosphaerae TaxID=2989719 RepID=A0ABT3G1E6_9BACT|nr:response regulator transcription factor [Luteolibacter rhizosphaerae]MCW1913650.1 response regulator transcription factor [Luteolibacter rhizosphaerae]